MGFWTNFDTESGNFSNVAQLKIPQGSELPLK